MTKSFNSWLNRVRFKPIVEPFKEVRRKIMRRMVRRKENVEKWVIPFPRYAIFETTIRTRNGVKGLMQWRE